MEEMSPVDGNRRASVGAAAERANMDLLYEEQRIRA